MCEPCGSRVVLRPFRGAADDAAFTVLGTAAAGRCCDAYLALGPGYRRQIGTQVGSDPREQGAWLEAAEPIADSLCSPESFAAEAAASPTQEPCLADSVPGTVMARAGDVPLPTPGMLDTTEMLRRAEVSFAAGRWDEARTGYFRMEREAMRDDLAVWGYVTWRMAQCDLRLGEALQAIERLTSALGMPPRDAAVIPGLREAAVTDLGRACAAAFQGAADVEAFLAEKVEGDELLAALGALAEAWESQGRAEEARAVRSAIERRRRASADGGSGP
jgi:tetratricopeptide (TPR) repeat protein